MERYLLRFDVEFDFEKREDRWAVYCKELGFFGYGTTLEEADQDAEDGLDAILAVHDSLESKLEYLSRLGISAKIIDTEKNPPLRIISHRGSYTPIQEDEYLEWLGSTEKDVRDFL